MKEPSEREMRVARFVVKWSILGPLLVFAYFWIVGW